MMKKIMLACLLIGASSGTYADDQLERMESVTEELTQLFYEAMLKQVESQGVNISKLKALIPDTKWDAPMREAASCVLNEYKQKIGNNGVDDFLDKIEALVPKLKGANMQDLENMADVQPKGITEAETFAINEACGMDELVQERMINEAFMGELMKQMGGFGG
jgi:uncharacterized protein (UPF0335 family)